MKKLLYTISFSIIFSISLFAQPGTLDPTFGTDGIAVVACGMGGVAFDISVLEDNSVVAAGYCFENTSYTDSFLAKIFSDGTLDESFGDGGTIVDPISEIDDRFRTVAIQGDGYIVAVGYSIIDDVKQLVMVRYTPEGDQDINFGSNGYIILADDKRAEPKDVIIQPDGKILVLYTMSFTDINPYGNGVNVARFNPDGTLDSSFGNLSITEGIFSFFDIEEKSLEAGGMELLPNGKVVLTMNYREADSVNKIFVTQLSVDGTPDASFGENGTTIIGTGEGQPRYTNDVKVLENGKILVGGTVVQEDGDYDQALWLLNSDGAVDTDFGNNGMAEHNIFSDDGIAIAIQPDGKILLGGQTYVFSNQRAFRSDFLLVRYNEDGSVDETFGDNGVAMTSIGGDSDYDYSFAVELQSDGKIIQAGQAYVDGAYRLVMIRYQNDIETNVSETGSNEFAAQLFPNPVNNVLNIKVKDKQLFEEVIIVDIHGKTVYKGKYEDSYNLSTYSPGIYAIQFVHSDEVLLTKKFIKQ